MLRTKNKTLFRFEKSNGKLIVRIYHIYGRMCYIFSDEKDFGVCNIWIFMFFRLLS